MVNILATGAVAVFHKWVAAPVDRVRMLVQCHDELRRHGRGIAAEPMDLRRGAGLAASLRRHIPTSLDFLFCGTVETYTRHIVRTEGMGGFFRGTSLAAISGFASVPLQMYVVSPMHGFIAVRVFQNPVPEHNPTTFVVSQMLGALVSGAAASAILYPVDVLRFVLMADVRARVAGSGPTSVVGSAATVAFEYDGARDLLRRVVRGDFANTSGARSQELGFHALSSYACLYRGLGLGVVGQVLHRTTSFGVFETICSLRGSEQFSMAQEFLAGYVMMGVCSLLLYPLDSVRRRYMRAGLSRRAAEIEHSMAHGGLCTAADAALHSNPNTGSQLAYTLWTDVAVHMYREEGPIAFFRGVSLLPLRSLVGTSAAFALTHALGERMLR